jgi:hypothetical protein
MAELLHPDATVNVPGRRDIERAAGKPALDGRGGVPGAGHRRVGHAPSTKEKT